MVSKVAVIALVGILAIPILLGYALNLTEETITDYQPDGEPINVTQLLKNDTAYTYTQADINSINTNFKIIPNSNFQSSNIMPIFEKITGPKSNLYLLQSVRQGSPAVFGNLVGFNYIYTYIDTDVGYVSINVTKSDDTIVTLTNVISACWKDTDNKLTVSYLSNGNYTNDVFQGAKRITWTPSADFVGKSFESHFIKTADTSASYGWIDISAGFHFENNLGSVNLPQYTKSVLFSINLNSITEPDYRVYYDLGPQKFYLIKTTDNDDNVSWKADLVIQNLHQQTHQIIDLYYDSTRTDNTYQYIVNLENEGITYVEDYDRYVKIIGAHSELRYIGGWQNTIGEANYYQKYEFYSKNPIRVDMPMSFMNRINITDESNNASERTPTMRMDGAIYSGFNYPIIGDQTYTPSDFRTNPTTTINDVQKYGTSITFADNVYDVDSAGNITLGTHKASIKGLKLESIPVPVGYENRINGNVISVTSEPSTITFNGQWGATITTIGNDTTTYTKTEWVAGQFAWDGIDTNFLIVGLITCLGVFVALGIYVRKSGKGMIPLLIVCGCCAGLFFCMI